MDQAIEVKRKSKQDSVNALKKLSFSAKSASHKISNVQLPTHISFSILAGASCDNSFISLTESENEEKKKSNVPMQRLSGFSSVTVLV